MQKILFIIIGIIVSYHLQAQYITNGNASVINCHCYQLTPAINGQKGSVWNTNKINLNNSFDFSFDINFGCKDDQGADGIVFILQPISTSIGGSGGGLGFEGIVPSVGIMMDTYQNPTQGDPTYDHISINLNGNPDHNSVATNVAGPATIISGNNNAEDCTNHVLRIVWDATTYSYTVYIDGIQRVQATINMVANIFNNDPMVYWGFSASTGGLNNEQKFCTRLNGTINAGITNNATCLGTPVSFTASVDAFIPITSYYWAFGDGTTSTDLLPPPHSYTQAGNYVVKFAMLASDGCVSDTATQTVTIGAKPVASFAYNDTCIGSPVTLTSTATISPSNTNIGNYSWLINSVAQPNFNTITSSSYPTGLNLVQHVVTSNIGCVSDTAYGAFTVHPKPTAAFNVPNTCQNSTTTLTPSNVLPNNTYVWLVNNVQVATTPTYTQAFAAGTYKAQLVVTNQYGCVSDTATNTFIVYAQPNAAYTYTDSCAGKSIAFNPSVTQTNTTYQWLVNNIPVATTNTYTTNTLLAGTYSITLIATVGSLCSVSNTQNITIRQAPLVSASASLACFGNPTTFTATLLNAPLVGVQYQWYLQGNNTFIVGQQVTQTFTQPITGNSLTNNAKLLASINGGCAADTIVVPYTIEKATVDAGPDLFVSKNEPFILGIVSPGIAANSLNWLPAIYLNNANINRPTGIISSTQLFTLTLTTPGGCKAIDSVLVTVLDTTAIYVPTIFTPNNDAKNDVLIPLYIGIKSLQYFNIYNRWGQLIFTTTSLTQGWNGQYRNTPQPMSTFAIAIQATDIRGKKILYKGTVTLAR